MKCERVLDVVCELGEGPVWDRFNQRLIWVDILKGLIYCYDQQKKLQLFEAGQKVGAVALKTSNELIAALGNGFACIDMERKSIKMIHDPEANLPDNRFNDGKCDPAGRFWAGTLSMSEESCKGSLYTLEKDLSVSKKIANVTCSNGMAWSKDHSTFFYIDTPTSQVVAYDYDMATGTIKNKRVAITIPEDDGYPDGMTIDAEDKLWIALWGGYKVEQWDPYTGRLIQAIPLPVSKVTSCTFGGKNLNDLYITTARIGLSKNELRKQPLAGSLFVARNCGQGLAADTFSGI